MCENPATRVRSILGLWQACDPNCVTPPGRFTYVVFWKSRSAEAGKSLLAQPPFFNLPQRWRGQVACWAHSPERCTHTKSPVAEISPGTPKTVVKWRTPSRSNWPMKSNTTSPLLTSRTKPRVVVLFGTKNSSFRISVNERALSWPIRAPSLA
jgi:hypothetical protein